jgi:hypothetical protein
MIERWMEEGIAAARAGNRSEAARLFKQVVSADQGNTEAWLWLSDALDNQDERRKILTWLLSMDPENRRARSRLSAIERLQRTAAVPPPPIPLDPAPSAVTQNAAAPSPRPIPGQKAQTMSPSAGAPVSQRPAPVPPTPVPAAPAPSQMKKTSLRWPLLLVGGSAAACLLVGSCLVVFTWLYRPNRGSVADTGGSGIAISLEETPVDTQLPVLEIQPATDIPRPTETPEPTLPPTATFTPLPTATPPSLPQFQDDFENGISDRWFGSLSNLAISDGRLRSTSLLDNFFVGDPPWNNYMLTFDICLERDPDGDEASMTLLTIHLNTQYTDALNYTAHSMSPFARYGNPDYYPDGMWFGSSGQGQIEEIHFTTRLFANPCNKVKLVVAGKNAELFWNDGSLYRAGSITPLDGAIGFSLYDDLFLDNVVIQPIP